MDESKETGIETSAPAEAPVTSSEDTVDEGPIARPTGWRYKGFRVFGLELWYASPKFQLVMVAIICFLCPGMFNALSGIGGGGQLTSTVSDQANTALNATFAVVAFFSGTLANRIGLRLTLSLGGLGYCVYAASFLSYSHTQNDGFVIFAGAFLGVCAGLLWCGQGAIMMSVSNRSSPYSPCP
jgi:hypothetical protein